MLRIFEGQIMYLIDQGSYNIYFLTEDIKNYISILSFYKSDDFAICGDTLEHTPLQNGRLEILIDNNNLFYEPLQKFLGNNESITIEDDMTPRKHGKKVIFERTENNNIKILFKYLEIETLNAYGINIKNILFDLRSKLDQDKTDIKDRLHGLFNDLYNVFKDYDKDNAPKKLIK
ncbi:MAG: hypothetical protein PHS24_03600 [Bacilli bacterium]|nr:hypothetical protein [Bacilli bacterium]MDD4706275.1 hypothetical protein [Bacilli bacterium]